MRGSLYKQLYIDAPLAAQILGRSTWINVSAIYKISHYLLCWIINMSTYMVILGCICHVCTYFQSPKRLRLHLYPRYIYFGDGSFAENNCSAIMRDKIEKMWNCTFFPKRFIWMDLLFAYGIPFDGVFCQVHFTCFCDLYNHIDAVVVYYPCDCGLENSLMHCWRGSWTQPYLFTSLGLIHLT